MERDVFRANNSSPSSSRTVLPPEHYYSAPPPHSYPSHNGSSSTRSNQHDPSSSVAAQYYPGTSAPIAQSHPHHHLSHGLHHRASQHSGFHGPPIPPARSSSLTIPASPDSAHRVPTLQLIQPTPTKKKTRRRSAGGGSISSGSPSLRGRTSTLYVETMSIQDDEDEDSDVARGKKEEERKQRAREKGRERQRRKRERDKRAREEARGTSAHLPVPSRAHSHTNLTALTATHPLVPHSAPSSVSSTYSSLPLSTSYYSLSPSQYGMSTGSTSVSGQSSPNVLFSPAISTPGIGYADAIWSNEGSMSQLDMTALRSRPRSRGGRIRTGSISQSASRRASREHAAHSPVVDIKHRPEKRRKSEPEPEEFRSEVGLGMIIGGGDGMNASWPALNAAQPGNLPGQAPRPRRTLSDGNVLQQAEEWPARSPTPPPVPSIPAEYRRAPGGISNNSEKATFFASSILLALGSETNQNIASILQSELGLGKEELESMHQDLAAVYRKWRTAKDALESRMSQVSLEEDKDKVANLLTTSPSISPPPRMQPTDSFITPNPVRLRPRVASTSQIPAHAQDSPLTQASIVRHRALSSSSRPGVSAVHVPPPLQTRWDSPPVPKSNTDSPTTTSLQTPSTGPGGGTFPISDSAPSQAWQQADGSQSAYAGNAEWPYQNATSFAAVKSDSSGSGLESPLTMTKQIPPAPMGPPPLRDPSQSQQPSALHWTPSIPYTPTSRSAIRQNTVPFTPPTPMPVKGGEAPMWYQQTFLPGQTTPHGQGIRPEQHGSTQMTPEQYAAGGMQGTPMGGYTPTTATGSGGGGSTANGMSTMVPPPMPNQADPGAVFGYGYVQPYAQ